MDIMDTKQPKKKNTVMLEINDSRRQSEYHVSEKEYSTLFLDFIKSLGYEDAVFNGYHSFTVIVINNIALAVNYDNASYAVRPNNWSKGRRNGDHTRKNRYISIGGSFMGGGAKIKFNTEIDADKLKKRIDGLIQDRQNQINSNNEFENKQEENICAVGNHYTEHSKEEISSIHIENGIISFCFNNNDYGVKITMDGKLHEAIFPSKVFKTMEAMIAEQYSIERQLHNLALQTALILAYSPLSQELQEWGKTQRYAKFYTSTMSSKFQ